MAETRSGGSQYGVHVPKGIGAVTVSNPTLGVLGGGIAGGALGGARDDWVESKQRGWSEKLNEALAEKDSLQAASIKVLTKRNEQANQRIQQLEELVNKKDERIERLVDIIIKKLGGFDG